MFATYIMKRKRRLVWIRIFLNILSLSMTPSNLVVSKPNRNYNSHFSSKAFG